jgi:DNA repair exonuclease SbcCD nuclease subunit
MKMLVVGDIHLGSKKSNQKYHEIVGSLFVDIVEYAQDNDISVLTIVGDFFDNRKHLTLDTIEVASNIGALLDNYFEDVYILIGNHDMMHKDRLYPTSLSLFNKYENIHIVDELTRVDHNTVMVPWLFDKTILENEQKDDILIGHFEMNGITLNASGKVAEGFNLGQGDFNDFPMVLSGHFHTSGDYGNIKYLGCPYEQNFNDMNNETGFYVLDTDLITCNMVPWNEYPKHIRLKDTDKIPDIEGNVVELHFTQDYGIDKNRVIVESYRELNPFKLVIKYLNTSDSFTEEEISEDLGVTEPLDLLIEYFGKAELTEGINSVILIKMIEKLYKEIKDES